MCTGSRRELAAFEQRIAEAFGESNMNCCMWHGTSLLVLTGIVLGFGQPEPLGSLEALHLATAKLVDGGLLREYQGEAVAAALGAPGGWGIAQLATGTGKSRIAAGIVACSWLLDGPSLLWLYMAPNRQLLSQMEKTFVEMLSAMATALGIEVGQWPRLSGYAKPNEDGLADAYGIICDEVHRIGAQSYCRAMAETAAVRRVGLSATPVERSDKKNPLVVGLLGPIVYQRMAGEMMEQNWLAKAKIIEV